MNRPTPCHNFSYTILLAFAAALTGIGIDAHAGGAAPAAPVVTMSIGENHILTFIWKPVAGADYYLLMVDKQETGMFRQAGGRITTTSVTFKAQEVSPFAKKEPHYRVDACNQAGCTPSDTTSESQVNMLNTPMTPGLQNAFDKLLDE